MVIPEAHRGMVQCVHVIGIMGKVKQEALILFLIGLLM